MYKHLLMSSEKKIEELEDKIKELEEKNKKLNNQPNY